jgi:hypothetical protein
LPSITYRSQPRKQSVQCRRRSQRKS